MKSSIILTIACIFTLFLATVAQASEFTDNTCYREGANCQTDEEWKAGWCEAAVTAGVFIGTAEQCVQPGGGGGRLAESPQNQNSDSNASSSRQSGDAQEQQGQSGDAQEQQRQSSGSAQAQGSSPQLKFAAEQNPSAKSNDDAGDGPVSAPASAGRCRYWRVTITNPNPVCVHFNIRRLGD